MWIPIERRMGHEVVGVWDGGSVHPPGYAEKFAADHAIPRVFQSLRDIVPEVDCAIIHGCDWDTHVEKARPFLDAGKAVLVDKPMAGNLRDLCQIVMWAEQGKRITGGSSLRYCDEVRNWLATDVEKRGQPHTVFCGCGVDEFNYGIHAYSLLSGIMGSGIVSVCHIGEGIQRRIQVNWEDGRMGLIAIGRQTSSLPFHASIVTERILSQIIVDSNMIYRAFLGSVLPYLSRQTDTAPVPMCDLIESELSALAARQSWLNGDKEVLLSELQESSPGYDGAAFAEEYKMVQYGSS